MESDWRFNVFLLGWTDSPWQLASRLLGFPGPVYIVKESDTQWGTWIFDPPLFGELAVRTNGPFPILAGQRFPFGFPVEPD